jgi:hypothetical protein
MSVAIRQAGSEWLIEVQREPLAAACTEAEAHELVEQWTAKLKWRASCRFAPPWLDEEEYTNFSRPLPTEVQQLSKLGTVTVRPN